MGEDIDKRWTRRWTRSRRWTRRWTRRRTRILKKRCERRWMRGPRGRMRLVGCCELNWLQIVFITAISYQFYSCISTMWSLSSAFCQDINFKQISILALALEIAHNRHNRHHHHYHHFVIVFMHISMYNACLQIIVLSVAGTHTKHTQTTKVFMTIYIHTY